MDDFRFLTGCSTDNHQLDDGSQDEQTTIIDIDSFLQSANSSNIISVPSSSGMRDLPLTIEMQQASLNQKPNVNLLLQSTPSNIFAVAPGSSKVVEQKLPTQGVGVTDQAAVAEEEIGDPYQKDNNELQPVAGDEPKENLNPNKTEKRSCDEVRLVKGTKKHASIQMKFNSFQVNWNKISDGILESLRKLQDFRNENSSGTVPASIQMSTSDLSGLANAVVDQLRSIDKCIRADIMETVARQMTNKFPCLNFVDDDGFGRKLGYVWLKHKMINRNTYLNRYKETHQSKTSAIEVRRNRNLRAGTVNEYWQISTKECPKEVLSVLSRNEPASLTQEILEVSQPYVRNRFDEEKPLKDVVANLPVLRRRCLLNFHFECATGVKAESLEKFFAAKRSKIIDFAKSKRKNVCLDAQASDYDIFTFLCRSLGENIDDIILLKEMGTKLDAITTDCVGPTLVAIDCGNKKRMYYVFAEQARLTEGTESLLIALTDLMCTHYVHNFMYNKQSSKFLEFIQEYFLKILPAVGSKSTATRKGQQQRVVRRLIKAIADHTPNT